MNQKNYATAKEENEAKSSKLANMIVETMREEKMTLQQLEMARENVIEVFKENATMK